MFILIVWPTGPADLPSDWSEFTHASDTGWCYIHPESYLLQVFFTHLTSKPNTYFDMSFLSSHHTFIMFVICESVIYDCRFFFFFYFFLFLEGDCELNWICEPVIVFGSLCVICFYSCWVSRQWDSEKWDVICE